LITIDGHFGLRLVKTASRKKDWFVVT